MCFLALFGVLCAGIASATSEVHTYFGTESGTGGLGGQFSNPRGIAVNTTGNGPADPGDIYVVDDNNHRIQRFDDEYDFVWAIGRDVIETGGSGDLGDVFERCLDADDCKAGSAGTTAEGPAGEFDNPQGIAVDQDTGNVYVSDRDNRRIQVFDGDGNFIRMWGFDVIETGKPNDNGTEFEVCDTTNGNLAADCKIGIGGPGVGQVSATGPAGGFGVAVSPPDESAATGKIFLANTGNQRVETYDLDGSSPANFGSAANFGSNQPRKVAVDSRGIVYATDTNNSGEIDRYDSENANGGGVGFQPSILSPPLLASASPLPTIGLAVDPDSDGTGPDNDALYVLRVNPEAKIVVQQFGPLNKPGQTLAPTAVDDIHGQGAGFVVAPPINAFGLGFNQDDGRLFVSANFGGGHRVYVLGFPLQPPTVSIDPVVSEGDKATFSGNVKTDKIAAGYRFEYSSDGGSNWTKVPTEDVQLPGDSTDHPVSVEVEGLLPGTLYQVRLIATKALGGGTATAETSFESEKLSPIVTASHSQVRDTSVTFEGTVNPQNEAAKYRFEYVEEEAFGFEGFAKAASTPDPAGSLPPGTEAVPVSALASGLTPATTYVYRLAAFNDSGVGHSEVGTFTTFLTDGGLPDGRAYEQASPVDKNGLDVSGTPRSVKASASGDRITFGANGGIPGGDGGQRLPTYLATRGSDDWSSQGILPPQSEGETGQVTGWTRDLAQIFSTARESADPATRTFLSRSSDTGAIRAIVPHTVFGSGNFSFAGTSGDASKVFFEASGAELVEKASPGENNLYVWDRDSEELSLVGLLPDSECDPTPPCAPPGGSFAGPYDWTTARVDRGGAASQYYLQDTNAISTDGSMVYFTAGDTGQLYLREDPTEPAGSTAHVSASQKENGLGTGGTDANGPRPAAFMAATPDGSQAFFTSPEKLTDDANTGPEPTEAAGVAQAEIDGSPVDLGFIPTQAIAVAVNSTHVYWANPEGGKAGEGTIGRAELDGDAIEPEFIPNQVETGPEEFETVVDKPRGIAVDDEHVYWTNAKKGNAEEGTISRADVDGNVDPEPCFTGASSPEGIEVDDNNLYWANSSVRQMGHGSKNCSGEPNQDFIAEGVDFVGGDIAVNASHIYYTRTETAAPNDGFVRRANLDGSSPVNLNGCIPILSEAKATPGIALDSSFIYLSNPGGNRIGRADLDCTPASVSSSLVDPAGGPRGLAVSSEHLYWGANQDVVPNPGNDLYRYDVEDEELTDLTVDETSENGAEVRGVLGVSDDGNDVYLVANGVLTDEPNAQDEVATPGDCPAEIAPVTGECNLYHLHGGEFDFIARLAHGGINVTDAANWTGTPQVGFVGGTTGFERTARVAPDGETLLFRSRLQLTAYDNEGKPTLYRYDASDESLGCISCSPVGEPPVGALPTNIQTGLLLPSDPAATLTRNLSEDGQRVFFQSTDPLSAADNNGDDGCAGKVVGQQFFPTCQDVYMWEANGAGSCTSEAENGGCLSLISTGHSPEASFLADASLTGEDVFIITRDRLVGQDADQLYDVYDARVGGGLASQNEPPEPKCGGIDPCRPGPTSPPTFESPVTPSFSGPSDESERQPNKRRGCPKGKRKVRVKGKVRCVSKQRARRLQRKRHARTAKTTRRASR